jgi:hypothetical protein
MGKLLVGVVRCLLLCAGLLVFPAITVAQRRLQILLV